MRVLLKPIGKRKYNIENLWPITQAELNKTMDDEVKPVLLKSHEVIVADWTKQPTFSAKKFVERDSLSLTVFPTGPYADIWRYVDQGTKPHPIEAQAGPYLIFPKGPYVPRTLAKPARTVSGGGSYADTSLRKVHQVMHPGSTAREFTTAIAEDIQPSYYRAIDNAFRRVARAVNKE